MVPTFILTRAFAISALFVGAFPVTHAAPIPSVAVSDATIAPRGCRIFGCLFASPTENADQANSTTTAVSNSPSAPSTDALQVIDFLISALTEARASIPDVASSPSTDTVILPATDAIPPVVEAATVNSPTPAVDATISVAEELASTIESDQRSPIVAEAITPVVEVAPVSSEAASLDALV